MRCPTPRGPTSPKAPQEIQGPRLSRPALARRPCLLRLTIKLGHLLTELHLPQDGAELRLVNAGEEPAVSIGEGLAEGRLQDLPGRKGGNKVSGQKGPEVSSQRHPCFSLSQSSSTLPAADSGHLGPLLSLEGHFPATSPISFWWSSPI